MFDVAFNLSERKQLLDQNNNFNESVFSLITNDYMLVSELFLPTRSATYTLITIPSHY